MPTATDFEREKLELETILASGIFGRAPGLAQLLTYICTKCFEGAAEELKEYNIAVEGLGRPADFNQKKDSIVRVEAHGLRKRLAEYYAGEGARHEVRIMLPPGQYAPTFEYPEPEATGEAESALSAAIPEPTVEMSEAGVPASPFSRWIWMAALLLAAIVVIAVVGYRRTLGAPTAAPSVRSEGVAGVNASGEIRILAGLDSGSVTDGFGRTWENDRYFRGGSVFHLSNHPISGTRDPRLYQNRREGTFGYDIPLEPGVYELRLHFAETVWGESNIAGGGEASRIFRVTVNGKPVLQYFDVVSDAGPSTADVRVFKNVSPAQDGHLHIDFTPEVNPAFVNAIEITPGIAGRMRPVRVLARDRGYTDRDGNYWYADRFARGGQLVPRVDRIAGAADPEIYSGERFGNFTYSIPVAEGRYELILHFAELWFGLNRPGSGGVGSRAFDILCNGVLLQRNLDIYSEAGGSERALTRAFHGITPNHQGKIVLSFVPANNYASINALEIIDESN